MKSRRQEAGWAGVKNGALLGRRRSFDVLDRDQVFNRGRRNRGQVAWTCGAPHFSPASSISTRFRIRSSTTTTTRSSPTRALSTIRSDRTGAYDVRVRSPTRRSRWTRCSGEARPGAFARPTSCLHV